MHARQQIREKAVALMRGLPTCGQNVFTGRPYPLQPTELPGIVIIMQREQSNISSIGDNPEYDRVEQLVFIGYANSDNIENDLDDIASDVEIMMGAHFDLQGLIKESVLTSTTVNVDGETRIRSGEIRLTFDIHYRTVRGLPNNLVQ